MLSWERVQSTDSTVDDLTGHMRLADQVGLCDLCSRNLSQIEKALSSSNWYVLHKFECAAMCDTIVWWLVPVGHHPLHQNERWCIIQTNVNVEQEVIGAHRYECTPSLHGSTQNLRHHIGIIGLGCFPSIQWLCISVRWKPCVDCPCGDYKGEICATSC